MKKLWSTVLLICLIAALMAPAALASPMEYENLYYTFTEGGVRIEGHNGDISGKLVIPDQLPAYPDSQPVVSIDYGAFRDCTALTEVVIPDTVTFIGNNVFSGCTGLTKVTLPNSVTSIEYGAFFGCTALTEITIPDSVTRIKGSAFEGCANLNKIHMSKNIEWIGWGAFADTAFYQDASNWTDGVLYLDNVLFASEESVTECSVKAGTTLICEGALSQSLRKLSLPASLKFANANSWYFHMRLEDFQLASDNPYYSVEDGVLFNKNKTELIRCVTPKSTVYSVPSTVQVIDQNAFLAYYDLNQISIPSSVVEIAEHAFNGCRDLMSVQLEGGNTHFIYQNGVLMDTDKTRILTITGEATGTVTIPATVTRVENCCASGVSDFAVESGNPYYQAVDGVLYENRYNYFHMVCCPGQKSGSITFPEGLAYMPGNDVFVRCDLLTSVTLSSDVKFDAFDFGLTTFNSCAGLKAIHVPESNTDYAEQDGVLFTKDLKMLLEAPSGMTGSYVIPDGTEVIGVNAFCDMNDDLKAITIPVSMREIKHDALIAFGVTDVYYRGTQAQWDAINLSGNDFFFDRVTLHFADDAPEAPVITAQPRNYVGAANSTAKFTVTASGDSLSYQWQYSDDNGATWLNSSLKTNTYSAKLTAEKDGRMVRCIITDNAGNSVTSDPAVMRISNLKITTQPRDYVGAVNSTAKFTVTATGDSLSYQWQYSDDNGATWLDSSLKTNTYSAKLTAEKDGRMVRCIVLGEGGFVMSDAVKMTISNLKITTQPKDYTGAVNSTAKFTVAASGNGLSYQWQYSDDNGATWLNSSLKTNTYSAKLTAEKDGRMVRCVVKDQSGASVISSAAKMTVSGVRITTQPVDYVGAVNSTAKFTVAASGTGLSYQWQYSDDNGRTWLASSIKSATYSAKFTADKNNRMVRCIVKDGNGSTAISDAVSMKIGPTITTQPKNYVGAVNSTAKFTVAASGTGLSYQWQYSDDNGKTWLVSSLKTAAYSAKLTAEKDGRMVRCVVKDANGVTNTTNAVSMKIG